LFCQNALSENTIEGLERHVQLRHDERYFPGRFGKHICPGGFVFAFVDALHHYDSIFGTAVLRPPLQGKRTLDTSIRAARGWFSNQLDQKSSRVL
jgi:hypothetical protein